MFKVHVDTLYIHHYTKTKLHEITAVHSHLYVYTCNRYDTSINILYIHVHTYIYTLIYILYNQAVKKFTFDWNRRLSNLMRL